MIEPAPDDPIEAARGALAHYGPVNLRELREVAREDERVAEERKLRLLGR